MTEIISKYTEGKVIDDNKVMIEDKIVYAKKAKSCLLTPKNGDLVVVYLGEKENYIVDILEGGGDEIELKNLILKIENFIFLSRNSEFKTEKFSFASSIIDIFGKRLKKFFKEIFVESEVYNLKSEDYKIDSDIISNTSNIYKTKHKYTFFNSSNLEFTSKYINMKEEE